MKIINEQLKFKTKGTGDLINMTHLLQDVLNRLQLEEGIINVFVIGSTAAITTFEYEKGLLADMKDLYDRLAPRNAHYLHDETWNDANGFSHVRSAIQGPSLTIPFKKSKLLLGTWQQIVLAEFDTRSRQREIVLTFIGQ